MAGWWNLGGAFLLLFAILLAAYLYKINWIKDLRIEGSGKRVLANHLESKKRKLGKLPPVYPNGWFALLETSQLKKGQVKHVAALGQNFAVFRTDKGTVRILDAYCPHLGANMAEGGRVKGDCLECPFHGWQFRGSDGQCNHIPYASKVPHIARTKTWKSCEENEIIFVWYHAEGVEPTWQPQTVSHVSDRTWRYQGRNEFLINCHIQMLSLWSAAGISTLNVYFKNRHVTTAGLVLLSSIIIFNTQRNYRREEIGPPLQSPICNSGARILTNVFIYLHFYRTLCKEVAENGADTAHLSAVHGPALFSNIVYPISRIARHSWINNGWAPHHSYSEDKNSDDGESRKQDAENLSHRAYTTLRHTLVLFEKLEFLRLDVYVQQIGPGYVELLLQTYLGPIYIFQTVTPMEPLLQKVTHIVYSPPLIGPYASIIFFAECLMFERDVAIWNRKKFEKQPLLVKEERNILAYRRWYSQFYSQHSPSYHSAMKSLQW